MPDTVPITANTRGFIHGPEAPLLAGNDIRLDADLDYFEISSTSLKGLLTKFATTSKKIACPASGFVCVVFAKRKGSISGPQATTAAQAVDGGLEVGGGVAAILEAAGVVAAGAATAAVTGGIAVAIGGAVVAGVLIKNKIQQSELLIVRIGVAPFSNSKDGGEKVVDTLKMEPGQATYALKDLAGEVQSKLA